MRLPGFSFFIVGIAVTLFSYFINKRTQTSDMDLFLFVGIVMVFFGLVRMVISGRTKQSKPENINEITTQPKQYQNYNYYNYNYNRRL